MLRKVFSVQALLWLALLLALVGSLRHVAWGFSTLENGDIVAGYVQAVAVDLGLFALAIGIQQRRRQRRGTFILWIGVLMFAALSTYANMLHGVVFKAVIDLGKWTSNANIVAWLDFMRPVLMSAVLPLLVVYLSEIAGSDASFALDAATKAARKAQKDVRTEGNSAFPMPIEQTREHKKRNSEQTIGALLAFYSDNPGASQAEAGAACGRSRSWVGNRLRELAEQGVISRNGDGVVVHRMAEV